jgi:hypothetical protein
MTVILDEHQSSPVKGLLKSNEPVVEQGQAQDEVSSLLRPICASVLQEPPVRRASSLDGRAIALCSVLVTFLHLRRPFRSALVYFFDTLAMVRVGETEALDAT